MSAEFESEQPDDELQFSTAEPPDAGGVAATTRTCALCRRPIVSSYFALNDKVLCPACCELVKAPPAGSPAGRLLKATVFGVGAALLGSLIWFAVRYLAHLQSGIVAVVVGFLVGKAVRKGSGGRGGRGYQIMALVLMYCCIAANYLPDLLRGVTWEGSPAELVVMAVQIGIDTLTVPIRAGIHSPIGLFIFGIALWEAWKFNTRIALPITGPYQVGPAQGGTDRRPAVGL